MSGREQSTEMLVSMNLDTIEPLRKRVPTRDADGRFLADFMMIIPGLRNKPVHLVQEIIDHIQAVCARYADIVVFVELNVRLNLLWISHRYRSGICNELASAMQQRIPSALLVGFA